MESFSMRSAWRYGVEFFRRRWLHHLIILLGIGILPLQTLALALAEPSRAPAAVLAAENGFGLMPQGGAAALLVMALGYVLQTGSYFASWRRGLARQGSLGGAIGFGLLAGVLATAVFAALALAAVFGASQFGSFGAWLLGALAFLIPLVVAFAVFYTLFAAVVATAMGLALLFAMVFGAVTGNIGLGAAVVGGSGLITVVLLVMSAILLWLAARLSCAAAVMADRRSFNLVAAIAESWRLTLEDQWAIVRYLALIAFGIALVLIALGVAAGVGIPAFVEGGPAALAEDAAASAMIGTAIGLPLALLAMLVPAGIYRELEQGAMTADVFA